VPKRVIVAVEKCVEGISMSWEPFMLNQFIIDCVDAKYKAMDFHYPWIFIFLAFITWEETEDAQFLGLRGKQCLVEKYQNFWYTTNK
jgi:hypothetical protein